MTRDELVVELLKMPSGSGDVEVLFFNNSTNNYEPVGSVVPDTIESITEPGKRIKVIGLLV